ncbi:MAG: VOC family protein [Rhizobacter sp.]|jgi:catechol 2,3-dioxygenase-like lactoylglutathione lyase family enzyme
MGVQLKKQAIDLGIVTTNGPAMLAFYRDVLGLQYLREMPMPGGSGVMHQLMCGDSMVKLVVAESTPEEAPKGGIQGATGYRYWTITISNLTEVMAQVAAAGHKIVVKERELRPGVTIGIVADPDGNWVEFLSVA